LQSILLMKQSVEHDEYTDKIILNGNWVELGDFKDVKNDLSTENSEIVIGFIATVTNKDIDVISMQYYLKQANEDILINNLKINFNGTREFLTKVTTGYQSSIIVTPFSFYDDINNDDIIFSVTPHDELVKFNKKSDENSHNSPYLFKNNVSLRGLFPYFPDFYMWDYIEGAQLNKKICSELNKKYNLDIPDYIEGEYFNEITEHFNFSSIHYISADRLGSKKYYEKITLPKFIHVDKRKCCFGFIGFSRK